MLKILAIHREKTPGKTLAKMDIEGAEFAVLEEAYKDALLCSSALTALTVEWHDKAFTKCRAHEVRAGCRLRNIDRC